jgi:uncharacterized protein YkwD
MVHGAHALARVTIRSVGVAAVLGLSACAAGGARQAALGCAGDDARVEVCSADPLDPATSASAAPAAPGAAEAVSAAGQTTRTPNGAASPGTDAAVADEAAAPIEGPATPLPDASGPLRPISHASASRAPAPATTAADAPTTGGGPSEPFVKRSADPVAPVTVPGAPAPLSRLDTFLTRLIEVTNEQRIAAGLVPVSRSVELTASAVAHSDDQAAHKTMGHVGSDGSTLADRVNLTGYHWSELGENVAVGYATPDEVMAGWMLSSDHRNNILKPEFAHIGVAVTAADDGTLYWTMDLGSPG